MDQILDWLNENELRAFPLLEGPERALSSGWSVPDNLIVDLQIIIPDKLDSDYISLTRLTIDSGENIAVIFGTDSEDFETFTITDPRNQTYPLYIRNSTGSLAVFEKGVIEFLDSHPLDTNISAKIPVEPCTCFEFFGAWRGVSGIYTQPEKTSEALSSIPKLPLESTTQASRMSGELSFIPGFNFKIAIAENLINLELGAGYGMKTTCRTSFISQDYLDCDELVSYINGIPPDANGNFKLTPGVNIDIISGNSIASFNDLFAETSNSNTIFVGFSFQDADLCATVNLTPSLL